MSLRSRMRDVVTIQTPAPVDTDDYGNDVPAWDESDDVFAVVSPISQQETDVDRETRVDQYLFFVGPEVEVDATCRVELADGTICRIIGTPIVHSTTRGPHHIEFRGEATTG